MSANSNELQSKLHERLTLGVSQSLGKRRGVCDVTIDQKGPADIATISHWESTHCCNLPSDIKQFFSTTNGFLLTWKVKLKDDLLPVGRMEINPITRLDKLAGYSTSGTDGQSGSCTLVDIDISDDPGGVYPHFDSRSRIFELDPCRNLGKVCLVFRKTKQGVPAKDADYWFLDKALRWHYITADFQSYFRLMLTNIGLPQWQYLYTDIGVGPSVQQWYSLYAPMRLEAGSEDEAAENTSTSKPPAVNHVDVNRVFKGREKKKPGAVVASQTAATRRKAGSPQPNRNQTLRGSSSSAAQMKSSANPFYR